MTDEEMNEIFDMVNKEVSDKYSDTLAAKKEKQPTAPTVGISIGSAGLTMTCMACGQEIKSIGGSGFIFQVVPVINKLTGEHGFKHKRCPSTKPKIKWPKKGTPECKTWEEHDFVQTGSRRMGSECVAIHLRCRKCGMKDEDVMD